jgi:universal stress protein A
MNDYKHVLVAIDFSPSSAQVLKKANSIALRNHAKLSLLHVIEYMPPIDTVYEPILTNTWVIDEQIINEQAQQSLQAFAKQHQLTNEQLHTRLGTPKYEISEFVKDQQCDLVVMGSHGRHGINILLGSTANALLHEMPCDILAIKITS